MRSILFLSFVLIGACAAREPLHEPAVGLSYADLALDTAAGREALRDRVDAAARTWCRVHGKDVTPQLIRTDKGFCLDAVRQSLRDEMPDAVRRAYAR